MAFRRDLERRILGPVDRARLSVAERLQRLARRYIEEGSSGMAKAVALDQLRRAGKEPTEEEFRQLDSELRRKGEEFARKITQEKSDA